MLKNSAMSAMALIMSGVLTSEQKSVVQETKPEGDKPKDHFNAIEQKLYQLLLEEPTIGSNDIEQFKEFLGFPLCLIQGENQIRVINMILNTNKANLINAKNPVYEKNININGEKLLIRTHAINNKNGLKKMENKAFEIRVFLKNWRQKYEK